MATNPSLYMNLPVPEVGAEPGPQWAIDLNNCLTILDAHDHASGSGQQITPNGININTDLSFGSNNATVLKSVRFTAQSSPLGGATNVGCLYESGVDLYYNDGSGNQIRLTQGGSIVGTAGSITGLVAPASATYNSGGATFVWQSAANVAASLDARNVILRNSTASSNGLTLEPPGAMGSNYTITLPSLPASTKIVTLTSSGTMSANYDFDNSTIEVSSNTIRVKDQGITAAKIANGTITTTQISGSAAITGSQLSASAGIVGTQLSSSANILNSQITATNIVFSSSCGAYVLGPSSTANVTNLSVTITTTGKPVVVGLMADGSGNDYIPVAFDSGGSAGLTALGANLNLLTNGVAPAGSAWRWGIFSAPAPAGSFVIVDNLNTTPTTVTYTVQATTSAGHQINLSYVVLYAYELK